MPGERPDNEDSPRRTVWAGIRGRSITTRVRSPPGSSLSRSGSPSRGQRASARTGLLSSRLERLFPSPRASRPSWDESPPRRSPFFFVGNGPQLSLFVGNGPQLSWATAPNSLSLRRRRPPTLVGNGPNPRARGHRPPLPLVWAPSLAGRVPSLLRPTASTLRVDQARSDSARAGPSLVVGRLFPARASRLCRSPLPVALRTARSQGWRARSPLPLASEAVWR